MIIYDLKLVLFMISMLLTTKRQQNVSLRNRQMSLKDQKCRGN